MRLIILLLFIATTSFSQVFEYNTIKKGQWNAAGEAYSDVWGYAANGREYAIIGSARYIFFFDVTDPSNIREVNRFGPYTSTSWREFKTYSHYAYAVTDGPDAGGLRIFDLQYLPDSVRQVRQTTAFFSKCHMPFIDEANARLYCAGTDTRNNGIIVLDLSTRPDSPSLVINQVLPRGYVHDVYVKNNVMYASHIYSGYISQYNCTGGSCTGELSTYQTTGYNHSSFMNADQTYLINAIETAGHPLWYFPINADGTINGTNFKKFKSKTLRDQYPAVNPTDTGNIGHNPYIVGNLAYVSYYTDGVQVFDISNVNNIRRVAYFDTDRGHTTYSPVFRGCWGTYPFLPSGNILASDIQSGLWVFSLTACVQNTSPTVSVTSPFTNYISGSNIDLNASATDNGTITKVDFYNGTTLLYSDSNSPYSYTITNATNSTYSITARAFDNCGDFTNSAVQSITTYLPDPCAGNTPPTITVSSSSASYVRGTSFTVNANATDNGTISKVNFYNSGVLIGSDFSTPYSISINPANDVSYGITARAFDNCGDSATSNLLTITTYIPDPCAGNTPPSITVSSSSASYVRGTSFTVNANATDNGTVSKVNFYNSGVLIGTDFSTPYSISITPANDVSYGITARAFDNCGDSATSNLLTITTYIPDPCAGNTPPSITVSSSSASYVRGTSFTVNANATDNGTVSKVNFYNSGVLIGTDFSTPYSISINPANDVSYGITARAFDNCGDSATSNLLTITTYIPDPCAGNTPPSITVSSSSASYVRGTSFTVNANATDNGTVSKVNFYNSGVLIGTDFSTPYSISINPANEVSYGITARAFDNCGDSATSNLLTITTYIPDPCAGNAPPTITVSSSSASYVRGTSFTVNANATDNGTVSKVNFYNSGVLVGTDLTSPYSITINPANNANYAITAKSYDNCGDSTTSNVLNIITTASCTDGVQNGTETGKDCGGSCSACGCTTPTNLSQNKSASQISTQSASYSASRAVDGIFNSSNFTRTRTDRQPWWQVDLGSSYKISKVAITHRISCATCVGEIKRFRLFVTNTVVTSFNTAGYVYEYNTATGLGNGETITIPVPNINGRYVRIWVDNGTSSRAMSLAEVVVTGCAATSTLQTNSDIPTVALKEKIMLAYPNPFIDQIQLVLDDQSIGTGTVQVYDVYGKKANEYRSINGRLNLKDLAAGAYILRVLVDKEMYMVRMVKY